ncbi:WD repeat-containing protein 7-like isoform X2 [Dendronephthya gigantea]|uniref:WD repeat-containing protein 7-like isoform X2 n=1 Tax=Dendronephthya gigantea TaxID=151771 RepID=UPI00106A3B97|nr:WD repeat-containing protein 7-like isoform X2 [Dendronephthya gigantea]
MSTSAVVPLVFWGSTPPKHVVTCILVTYDQKTVITGSKSGQLGVWDVRHLEGGKVEVVAKSLIFGHSDLVSALACACVGLENQSAVISAAENGELCLWDVDDGLCIQTNTIAGAHTSLLPFHVSTGGNKEWRVVCHGYYLDVYVVDVLTLEVLYTLSSSASSNWLAAACVVRPPRRQEDVLVGITLSGTVKIWPLKRNPENKAIEAMYDQSLSQMAGMKALHVVCNPFSQRTILIVSAKQWQMYDVSNFQFLTAMSAGSAETWSAADFVQSNCVLVWSKIGKAYMYRLPQRCCPEKQVVPGQISIRQQDRDGQPELIYTFQNQGQKKTFNGSRMMFSFGRREPFHKLIVEGNASGRVNIWRIDQIVKELENNGGQNFGKPHEAIPCSETGSFIDVWLSSNKPCGLLDSLDGRRKPVKITSSLFLAAQGRIACGRQDGSIIIISATKAAKTQFMMENNTDPAAWPKYQKLIGHRSKVTCLLYPYGEYDRYAPEQFVSGSADFTVKLWSLTSGALLASFSANGGEILRLTCTPPESSVRIQHCVCSIAQDHSVALLNLRDHRCLLLASCHRFPVQTVRWKPAEDFLIIGLSDGSVYVWQIETGTLDRYVTGDAAVEILNACDEESGKLSTDGSLRPRTVFTKKLSHIATNIPKMPSQMSLRKVKRTRVSSPRSKRKRAPTRSPVDSYQEMSKSVPVRVTSLKTGADEPEIHVMLFDMEALICHLLVEEVKTQKLGLNTRKANKDHSKHVSFTSANQVSPNLKFLEEIHDGAQLLVSCLHSWGLDPEIDETCTNRLGLLKPIKPISFGLLTHRKLSLIVPGWYSNSDPTDGSSKETGHKKFFESRWEFCSALTTQHSLSIVALTNTLMSMSQVSFLPRHEKPSIPPPRRSEDATKGSEVESPSRDEEANLAISSMIRANIKAGWSRLATLYCCLLPDKLDMAQYRPPLLHVLARRWQDRCLEIREAAQAILVTELRRINMEGRAKVVETWVQYLPQEIEGSSVLLESTDSDFENSDSSDVSVGEDDFSEDVLNVLDGAKKLFQYDASRRQATSIIMLAVIGSEFQKDLGALSGTNNKGEKSSNDSQKKVGFQGEMLLPSRVVYLTSRALMFILLKSQSQSSRTLSYTSMRRAAIDLIGRGFPLWEPYMDVSAVLMALLELCPDNRGHVASFSKGLPLSSAADSQRSARHALTLISTARPLVFITTLAKEVARSSSAQASLSFNQASPAAIAVYSHVRHQPSSADVQHSSTLHRSKKEILRVLELMIDKTQQEVIKLLPEVVQIIVHCIEPKQLKERSLEEIFSALFKFHMVSYCPNTRRLAVGSKSGQLTIYELRSSKEQIIPAHSSAITAVRFSKDSKLLATYSYEEAKINFWQTSSSLFGVLGSGIKCTRSSNVSREVKITPVNLKQTKLVWVSQKSVVLLLADGTQHKFTA